MRDFYCTYEAQMTEDAVRGSLVDRTYSGEMDVQAENAEAAREAVKLRLKETHPTDTLLSCECQPF